MQQRLHLRGAKFALLKEKMLRLFCIFLQPPTLPKYYSVVGVWLGAVGSTVGSLVGLVVGMHYIHDDGRKKTLPGARPMVAKDIFGLQVDA